MGTHDGRELNRPRWEFSLDETREPFPIATYRVADETYPNFVLMSDGTVKFSAAGSSVPTVTAITVLTDSTGRTPDSTLANHADLSTYATDAAVIEQNISDLGGKINEIIAIIKAAGIAQ